MLKSKLTKSLAAAGVVAMLSACGQAPAPRVTEIEPSPAERLNMVQGPEYRFKTFSPEHVKIDYEQYKTLCRSAGVSQYALDLIKSGPGGYNPAASRLLKNGMIDSVRIAWEDQWVEGKECRVQVTVSGQVNGNDYRNLVVSVPIDSFKLNAGREIIAFDVATW